MNYGYSDAILMENGPYRMVLCPSCGGRILEFSFRGKNVLYTDPAQNGWIYGPGKKRIDPSGGRFDLGPEKIIADHPALWLGAWRVKKRGRLSVLLESPADPCLGVQLERRFTFDPLKSVLRIHETIRNISDKQVQVCYWSRTMAKGGGKCFIPLNSTSRFPNHYLMYGLKDVIFYKPEDPAITRQGDMLTIEAAPRYAKLGMDSLKGWMAYSTPDNLLLLKKFPVYPERRYNEMAGFTVSVYYYKKQFCEIEPLGPEEKISPGKKVLFWEEWKLLPWNPEKKGAPLTASAVKRLYKQEFSCD